VTPLDLTFEVIGRPQGKGSKRAMPIKGRTGQRIVMVDSNKNAAPWAATVSAAAAEAMGDHELEGGAVIVSIGFYFGRPRMHYGVGKNINRVRASAPRHKITAPDLDKLARCALDALIGVVVRDDAQITGLHLAKLWGEPERAAIRVRSVEVDAL
jgi:Holliday junction resolvase RusA-like endonuclease